MKILYATYAYWPPDFGGELLISIERLSDLARQGDQVRVLTSGRPGFPSHEMRDGIEVFRSPVVHDSRPGRLLRRLLYLGWVLWWIARMEYHVLHLEGLGGIDPVSDLLASALAARIAHHKGSRTIWVHSLADTDQVPLDLSGVRGWAKRLFLSEVDIIVCVSPALYDSVKLIFPSKACMMPYGLRDGIFVPLDGIVRQQTRDELGSGQAEVVFLFLGSLTQRKGFDLLVDAFLSIGYKFPQWHLWVIGPRKRSENQNLAENEIDELVQPLQGNPQVKFIGRVDERQRLARLMGSGDVFVFPSRREGMGIAPMEAMAAGIPAIITRIPGVTDLVNIEGVTGLYITPGNVAELRQAMQKLGMDAQLRQRMGVAARQRIVESFGWQKYLKQWHLLYSGNGDIPGD